MTPEQAVDGILDIFKATWDPTGFPAHYTDKAGEKPTSETLWARATIRHATGNQTSLAGASGTRRFTETGTLFVQVFAPVGDGSTECYKAATLIRDAYRDAKLPNLWFRSQRIQEVGESGAFYQINVLVTFSYDHVR
jgi:hypothetical protein